LPTIPLIFFNVESVRIFLIKEGFVYTLRQDRSVGIARAVTGAYRCHKQFASVDVKKEIDKPVTDPLELRRYFPMSGWKNIKRESLAEWFNFAKKIHNGAPLFLYKVTKIRETKQKTLGSGYDY